MSRKKRRLDGGATVDESEKKISSAYRNDLFKRHVPHRTAVRRGTTPRGLADGYERSRTLYPRTADLVHIEGIVWLRVSTDGTRVSDVKVESEPPMLAKAAADNVRTWEFSQHKPTTFKVKFSYRILPESGCYVDNSVVMLRLPTEVEVSTKGVHTCDPRSNVQ